MCTEVHIPPDSQSQRCPPTCKVSYEEYSILAGARAGVLNCLHELITPNPKLIPYTSTALRERQTSAPNPKGGMGFRV